MLNTIRALPLWVEIAVVVTVAFGLFILSAITAVVEPSPIPYTAGDFRYLVTYEIAIGTLLLSFLFARGWRISRIGLVRPRWRDAWHAVMLLIGVIALSWLVTYATGDDGSDSLSFDEAGIGLATITVISVINAIFEEIFVCAYIVSVWNGKSVGAALAASTLLRISYHVYQGPAALLVIGPIGLLFAWYFASRRTLWPLIAAHAALDILAFLPYVRG